MQVGLKASLSRVDVNLKSAKDRRWNTPNPPTSIVDFRGFDSSIILNLRGGILLSFGDFPESLSQPMLVGIMLVGKLGVGTPDPNPRSLVSWCL